MAKKRVTVRLMPSPMRTLLFLFAAVIASSRPSLAQEVAAERLLFIGNSITLHGPAPKIGWTGKWGMAASEAEKDYVYRVVAAVAKRHGKAPEFRVANVADFERAYEHFDLAAKLKEPLALQPDVVVVAIGENVPALKTDEAKTKFRESMTQLLTLLKGSGPRALFVRSCFWADAAKDAAMKEACTAVGGVFIDIGTLGKDERNYARSERKIDHEGVARHPGDEGMNAIADAIVRAMTDAKILR